MTDFCLRLYHWLPPRLRSAAAGAYGFKLRLDRYGPETEQLVEEALERETWSSERWRSWSEERLAFVLHRAATRVPHYRAIWRQRRAGGDGRSWEQLENWPLLEKEQLRQTPRAFVADGCNPRSMAAEHTSGSTGTPLTLWRSLSTIRARYALYEARRRRWYGITRHDRWAMVGGRLVAPAGQQKPPFWVWNAGLHQLYLSSYHLSPERIPHYIEALLRHRVHYIWGYPSSLYALAQGALERPESNLKLRVAIANAEPVFAYQRRVIERAFGCPLRETYGMVELVAGAGECGHGNLHQWPEMGQIEVFQGDRPTAGNETGDLVCTSLLDADMPLIRYRVGDRGRLPDHGTPCSCGRRLPLLTQVEGRSDDVLYTRDGRAVGRLDPVFKADLPIREAQVIQESLHKVRIVYVPAAEFTPGDGRLLTERLREHMGAVEVVIEPVDRIPRGPNGKFRAVVRSTHAIPLAAAIGTPTHR